ncbi:unnamed protein product [Victoria cruziana]
MAFMRGEPLLAKLANIARFVVFPAAMAASLIYVPPVNSKKKQEKK